MSARQWLRDRFVNADAVYGTILFAALIAGVSDEGDAPAHVLFVSAFSLIVFWGAHVYARTVTNHGVKAGKEVRLGVAMRTAFQHSAGMLYAAIAPSIFLVLGIAGVFDGDTAVDLALVAATVLLGLLGYGAFHERQSPMIIRILGGAGTALFGALMIGLNYLVH